MVDVLSQKMWGQPEAPRSFDEHKALAAKVGGIPFCNPLYLNEESFSMEPGLTPMRLRKGSKGPDYHLTMELMMPEEPVPGEEQVLLGLTAFHQVKLAEFSLEPYAVRLLPPVKCRMDDSPLVRYVRRMQ